MANGFILLDKPSGITSRQAGWRVAKILGTKKFGHVGTLDPMASGLLIIALGEATKMIPYISDGEKEYLFGVKWGIRTDTGDITGSVLEENKLIPKPDEITAVLPKFIGEYDQMPPAYSAKKIDGVPAYKLARRGREVRLRPKKVKIYELGLDSDVYNVKCSEGTYVRSLVQDIAEKVPGGYFATCSMIRRNATNGFSIDAAIKLDFLENMYNNGGAVKDYLKPLDFGLDDIPVAKLETDPVLFSNGGFVAFEGEGLVRVYSKDNFIGMGMIEDGVLKPKRIINVDR